MSFPGELEDQEEEEGKEDGKNGIKARSHGEDVELHLHHVL